MGALFSSEPDEPRWRYSAAGNAYPSSSYNSHSTYSEDIFNYPSNYQSTNNSYSSRNASRFNQTNDYIYNQPSSNRSTSNTYPSLNSSRFSQTNLETDGNRYLRTPYNSSRYDDDYDDESDSIYNEFLNKSIKLNHQLANNSYSSPIASSRQTTNDHIFYQHSSNQRTINTYSTPKASGLQSTSYNTQPSVNRNKPSPSTSGYQTSSNIQPPSGALGYLTLNSNSGSSSKSNPPSISSRTVTQKQLGPVSKFSWKLYLSSNVHNNINNNILNQNTSYNLVTLSQDDSEYITIKDLFMKSAPDHYVIHEIQRHDNPFLYGCYQLKKEELRIRHGQVFEIDVFHGTKASNIPSICQNNFNWRLHGKNKGNRFGKGVSFSEYAYYASHPFYRQKKKPINVMFVIKMAYSYMAAGQVEDELPPISINHQNQLVQPDTTFKKIQKKKKKNEVVVKYSDHEFYPIYIIHYSGHFAYPRGAKCK